MVPEYNQARYILGQYSVAIHRTARQEHFERNHYFSFGCVDIYNEFARPLVSVNGTRDYVSDWYIPSILPL